MTAAVGVRASQAFTLVAAIHPAATMRVSQANALVAGLAQPMIKASQAFCLVAALGVVADPHVRVWTFTLDGHDFYVLRLGNEETLVYDVSTKTWSTWGSGDTGLWKAYNGCNWQGFNSYASSYGSNIVAGDDGTGTLYILDPTGAYDDDPVTDDVTHPFTRVAVGQIALHGYDAKRCFRVTLRGSIGFGDDQEETVKLEYSDDSGIVYSDAGTRTVVPEEYDTRVQWRSIGSIRYPGRLFKVTDYGAFARIDSMDISTEAGDDGRGN